MNRFPGFPNRPNYVAIPRVFFSDILPFIQDMAELLVTLQLFRLLGAKRGYPRAAAYHELMEDRALVTGFSQLGRDFRDAIPQGLETAVQRGTFLRVTPPMGEPWILLNSDQNRRAAPAIPRGEMVRSGGDVPPAAIPVSLPQQDIFTLYEQTIGLLTPLLAERLQEAEGEYPAPWVQEAFQIAAEKNQRHWRYVEAILERWKAEGRDDGTPGGYHKAARDMVDYSDWLPIRRTDR